MFGSKVLKQQDASICFTLIFVRPARGLVFFFFFFFRSCLIMGGCQSNVVHQEIEPFMAMWVLKVSDFIKMELPMPKHEELLERGLLRRRELTDYCIFVSHQWISTTHPDPAGHQLRVLQQCLVHICDHQLSITNDAASQFLGEMKKLSKSQRDKVRKAVLWIDWASIPQVETFRNEDDEEDEICQLKRERSSRTFVYRSPASPKRVSESWEDEHVVDGSSK